MYRLLQKELSRQLATVDRHIAQSERNVVSQRHRVAAQRTAGSAATFSSNLLQTFEQSLALHHRHREQIIRDLKG